MSQPGPKPFKKFLKFALVALALVAVYEGYLWVPVAYDAWKAGFFERRDRHAYAADNEDNLRALYTGLMLYHESEGKFPEGNGWMDAVEPYLRTQDLRTGEEKKKLVHPMFWPPNGKDFGYAINDACAGKYKDDVGAPEKTALVFDSSDTSRNAHGDPQRLSPTPPRGEGNLAISVSGKILKL
jgi:hypothetical protein